MSRSYKNKSSTRKTKFLVFDSEKDTRMRNVWQDAINYDLEEEHARKVVGQRMTERVDNRV